MTELIGKTYCRTHLEFVDAAELPEDAQFGGKLFLKGDFVIKYKDGTQAPMNRASFLRHFRECIPAVYVYDSIDEDKRIIKFDDTTSQKI